MRNILFVFLGAFILIPLSLGYCDDPKTAGINATPEQPLLLSPEDKLFEEFATVFSVFYLC